MIIEPLNDRACLGTVTEFVRRMQAERGPELAALAAQFPTTRELARWIRRKPQVDDNGNPDEGPKVYACRPPQRMRLFWETPNCFERTVEYVLLAELIDSAPKRAMATVNTRFGRHTLPIENNQAVVLDPVMTRNELEGALFQLDRRPLYVTRNEALEWMATIAEEPAAVRGEVHRVRNARAAMRAVMTGQEITAQAIAGHVTRFLDRASTRLCQVPVPKLVPKPMLIMKYIDTRRPELSIGSLPNMWSPVNLSHSGLSPIGSAMPNAHWRPSEPVVGVNAGSSMASSCGVFSVRPPDTVGTSAGLRVYCGSLSP